MSRFFYLLIPVLVVLGVVAIQPGDTLGMPGADTTHVLEPLPHHSEEAQAVSKLFSYYHYRKTELNDSLSAVILDNYIRNLDYNKIYFLESDITALNKFRNKLDDYFEQGEVEIAFSMYGLFEKRFNERMAYFEKLMDKEFDFTLQEEYDTDREDLPYAASREELNEIWRKMVKNQALSLKLTGKEDEEIRDILVKRYERLAKNVKQVKPEDIFQLYLNAMAESYDPHTSYFSPITSENFKIQMSQSLEGIGASLRMSNDYVEVAEIVAGGPAFKSKLLNKDDKIIGVAQGDEGEMVDVIGWRLDDVVQLIRGPKGTKVKLEIIPAEAGANGLPQIITLIRDKVKLEEQAPTLEVMDYNYKGREMKLGVINIPSFYLDFEAAQRGDKDYKSTTRDVRNLLKEAQDKGVDGVVVDLRFNGGGSLTEAIELTGLFIGEGPVVQVRDAGGSVDVMKDPDEKMVYAGPLAVLVNRFSASASEIFAGAIQDYERGIILGEQTYGKGTVQNLLDLDRFIKTTDSKLGQVKLTLAKFYRVSGSSTQHRGVTPDIEFPSVFSAEEFGESSKPSALPWDKIGTTDYYPIGYVEQPVIRALQKSYDERLETDKNLQEILAEINLIKQERENTTLSLNLEQRKMEREKAEQRRAAMEKIDGALADGELYEADEEEDGEDDPKKQDEPYILESIFILAEFIAMTMG